MELNDDDMRQFATDILAQHTPENQPDNPFERCSWCNYTRHPCDTYDLAEAVLKLLDRLPAGS